MRVAVVSLANNAVVVNCINSTECGDRHLPQLDHSATPCKIQDHHKYTFDTAVDTVWDFRTCYFQKPLISTFFV